MSEVLLGQAYYLRFDDKLWQAQQPYAPLGTLYAAVVPAPGRPRGVVLRRDAGAVRGRVGGGARSRAAGASR